MATSLPELDLAWSLLNQQRFPEAARQARAVLATHPGNISALVCHAMANWKADGDIAISIAEVKQAVAAAPAEASIRHNLATLYASAGDMAGAASEFEAALKLKPDDTLAFYGLTQNMKFGEQTDVARAMLALHAGQGLDPARREFLAFGLAKVFDDLGDPERAMGFAIEANRLGERPWDLAGERGALDELRELARLDAFRRAAPSGDPSTAPVFIVGMNRSGTTLVETILARHPDVLALGESNLLPALEAAAYRRRGPAGRGIGRHQLMLELPAAVLTAEAGAALGRAKAKAGRPFTVMTDKLPENALRLGLASRLFPKAKVIYVRRHPLDTGVSNFFQRFSAGQGYSNRLDWIGVRTRQIADSMVLWKQALDQPILDVSYERLVAEPEAEARRIAEFAGLSWTPALLDAGVPRGAVLTASQWQVRQPINSRSVARWKRYESWLGPMITAMGGMEWVEGEVADAAAYASVANRSNIS